MNRFRLAVTTVLAMLGLAALVIVASTPAVSLAQENPMVGSGQLQILDPGGKVAGACPLKHTEVVADIAGYVARTSVKQAFHNPLDRKIEAVYAFPLPQDAAVDEMIMTVGDRRIVGQVKPREQAREIYEAAKAAGHVASLLDQERPNIFTQSVANIEPGAEVIIEIRYVETLKYADGSFEFMFPMVVGPRYIPGQPTTSQGAGWSPDTDQVPDASKITPPVAAKGTRAGHDISLAVHLDAGMPIQSVESALHKIDIKRDGETRAAVTLAAGKEIPNKDFILRYRLAAETISDAFLVHTDDRGTYFALVLAPPKRVLPRQAVPKEMIFVIDRSGSQHGLPIEKSRETMRLCIEQMNPDDTFNLISFSSHVDKVFDRPAPNTDANRHAALDYLSRLDANGGTEMMGAINAALNAPADPKRVRIVCFMTDGYVGNDMEIIAAAGKHAGTARVFSFGIGNSVNRFLLDGLARAGRGQVEYVTLQSQSEGAAERFQERIQAPVLTDIRIDWGDLPVADVYPAALPDLFASKPLMIHGRLKGQPKGTITLRGRTAAGDLVRAIEVQPIPEGVHHEALASLWARAKVEHLMNQDLAAAQRGAFPDDLKQQVTALGVEFHLVTQFTSFVAVEEMTVTVGGKPTTVAVPVEMPEGVSHEGVFGRSAAVAGAPAGAAASPAYAYAFRAAPRQSAPLPSESPSRSHGLVMKEQMARKSSSANKMNTATAAEAADAAGTLPTAGKLDPSLKGLARKVLADGRDGNLAVDGLKVTDYKLDVMIYLSDASDKTLEALRQLGFIKTGESKAIRLLVGTIDVRRLEDLARLDAVVRVAPVKAS